MNKAQGKYFIDGIDLWTAFGMFVESGSDAFLRFPQRKDSLSHDWEDSNGIDIDLSRTFFKERDVTLNMAIVADNEADFWNKYNKFLTQLAQPGTRRLTITELSRSFFVYYKDCGSFSRFTRIKGTGKIGCKFSITIVETEPAISYSDVFIVDDLGRLLVT